MIPKIIKNEKDYKAALARINDLMEADPDTPEGNELDLFVTLVELYEKAAYPIDLPNPVEAIKFRMEQLGLKQKDLIPFMGSRSRVSEVFSHQRPLSISMIRKLHHGLGIPAEILLREPGATLVKVPDGVDWERFPIVEMLKRNWLDFQGTITEARRQAGVLISRWAARLGVDALRPALLRQHVRSESEADGYALAAWQVRVSLLAMEQNAAQYQAGIVTLDFARDLVRLSYLDNGPLLAREFLLKNGIRFAVEKHLPHTHLDGAAIKLPDGSPLVALTLRYDRLDNFWFTLCHKLAHVAVHFKDEESTVFFDDLDQAESNACESEADCWATDALIPHDLWYAANMEDAPSARKILDFAANLRISPAIPAGRIRREKRNYKIYSGLVGNKKVRKLFDVWH
jgi:HTH-type transcriptional regulator/antitoxin HigA